VAKRLLGSRLPGRVVEVINAGTQGYGTAQELLFYEAEGVKYSPDIVLVGLYVGNDLNNNYFETTSPTKPSFSLTGDRLVFHPPRVRPWVGWVRDHILVQLVIARVARDVIISRLPSVRQGAAEVGLLSTDPDRPEDAGLVEKMIRVAQLLFDRLAGETSRRGARLGVVAIPAGMQLLDAYPAGSPAHAHLIPGLVKEWNLMQDRLQAHFRERGIPYLNASPVFRRAIAEGQEPYLAYTGHLSAVGHDVLARAVADWLEGAGLVASVR
jgi:lysophospholipase L1-like esterase